MGAGRPPRALLAAVILCVPVLAFSSASTISHPADAEARAALDLVYDGDFDGAEARLAALAREHPDDPVLPYLQALALEWRLEQDPASRAHDAEALALADRALGLAGVQLGRDPGDARALLARGAAHGLKSRLHLFRWNKGPASREAVRMREALLAARATGTQVLDLDSASGSTTTTPTPCPASSSSWPSSCASPGATGSAGSRGWRGSRAGAASSTTTRRACRCTTSTPTSSGSPTGPFTGSARCGGSTRAGRSGGSSSRSCWASRWACGGKAPPSRGRSSPWRRTAAGPNYQPVVAAMARVLLAEALLGDLRFAEAREAALGARSGAPGTPWVTERAERVLARCLDLERRAGSPEALALALLAQARRLREQGDEASAEAACCGRSSPTRASDEGRLCAARESLRQGRPAAARELARAVLGGEGEPWLQPFARLVLARALEAEGARTRALDSLPPRVGGAARAGGAARRGGRGDPAPRPATTLPDAPPLER